jgi:hypothetical protein
MGTVKCGTCNARIEGEATCPECVERLRQLNRDLVAELATQKAWTRSFWNAKKKAEAEAERLKGELQRGG